MKNIESLADCLTQKNNFSLPPDTIAIVLLFLLMLWWLLFSASSWGISPIKWNKIILIWNQIEF